MMLPPFEKLFWPARGIVTVQGNCAVANDRHSMKLVAKR